MNSDGVLSPQDLRVMAATYAFCNVHPQIVPAGWEFRMRSAIAAADALDPVRSEVVGLRTEVAALRAALVDVLHGIDDYEQDDHTSSYQPGRESLWDAMEAARAVLGSQDPADG